MRAIRAPFAFSISNRPGYSKLSGSSDRWYKQFYRIRNEKLLHIRWRDWKRLLMVDGIRPRGSRSFIKCSPIVIKWSLSEPSEATFTSSISALRNAPCIQTTWSATRSIPKDPTIYFVSLRHDVSVVDWNISCRQISYGRGIYFQQPAAAIR